MNYKEKILTDIIDDVKKKGSPISGWSYSANGKIIVWRKNNIPLFCINIFQTIDLLLHQYNLTKKYGYLYSQNRTVQRSKHSDQTENPDKEYTLEEKAIKLCDAIVFSPTQSFNAEVQNKIFHAMYRANNGQHLHQDDFLILRSKLDDYYTNLQFSTYNSREKEHLRKVSRFFSKLKYRDFNELF